MRLRSASTPHAPSLPANDLSSVQPEDAPQLRVRLGNGAQGPPLPQGHQNPRHYLSTRAASPTPTVVRLTATGRATQRRTAGSLSAWVVTLNGGAISWKSKQGPRVASSTTESEFVARPPRPATRPSGSAVQLHGRHPPSSTDLYTPFLRQPRRPDDVREPRSGTASAASSSTSACTASRNTSSTASCASSTAPCTTCLLTLSPNNSPAPLTPATHASSSALTLTLSPRRRPASPLAGNVTIPQCGG